MPGITPSRWLPLVVIRVISNLSYTLQRYNFFLKVPNILATFFDIFLLFWQNKKVHEKALTFRVLFLSTFLLSYYLYFVQSSETSFL